MLSSTEQQKFNLKVKQQYNTEWQTKLTQGNNTSDPKLKNN